MADEHYGGLGEKDGKSGYQQQGTVAAALIAEFECRTTTTGNRANYRVPRSRDPDVENGRLHRCGPVTLVVQVVQSIDRMMRQRLPRGEGRESGTNRGGRERLGQICRECPSVVWPTVSGLTLVTLEPLWAEDMDQPNPYMSSNCNPSMQGSGCGTPSRTPSPRQAVKASWCCLFAAVVLGLCTRAIHHEHHGGADDPEFLLGGLCAVAIAATFAYGVIAVVRGCRTQFLRTILFVSLPLLLSGGLLVMFFIVVYFGASH
jgi:hypothetical protein